MANAARGAEVLDMARASRDLQRIAEEQIDFEKYEFREEHARVIPAERLAEEGKKRMLLGHEQEAGLTLPWSKADGKVLIKPGKLVIWTGWSHHGKSQMAKNAMLGAINQGEKVCIASMEEEVQEVWVDMGLMACGRSDPGGQRINQWIEFCSGSLWFYDQQGSVSSKKIKAVIRYAAEELGITQFVVDSLMMLSVSRDDYDAQSMFVGDLKTLAKDTGCTIHLVAHLKKSDGKTGEEAPGRIHDIAGGHEIASKADYVFNVWRDKAKKVAGNPDCILGVEKQRGRVNWIGRLGLNYHEQSRQYTEGAEAHDFFGPVAF